MLSNGQPTLFGKEGGENLLRLVTLLKFFVGVQDQCLDERLSLLATRFPNSLEGQGAFVQ